jgi:hypothetical protein
MFLRTMALVFGAEVQKNTSTGTKNFKMDVDEAESLL